MEKIYAMKLIEKCKKISQNATTYIKQFLDERNEDKIQLEIIKRYMDKIN